MKTTVTFSDDHQEEFPEQSVAIRPDGEVHVVAPSPGGGFIRIMREIHRDEWKSILVER